MKSIHKPLVAITILGAGVFLFFLARCGETHSNAKTDTNPGAEDFQPIVLEKQTVDQKSTAEFGKKSQLADGKVSDQAASRAAMRSALETGAELYSTNSSDLIRQLKDKLAIIPKNLHNAFWRKFIEGAAEVGDTNYHLQKLTNLDPNLKDFLTAMTTADSSSVLEGLAAAMSQQGYSKNPDEFARSIQALPEASEYQIENKKLWTKIAVQGKLYSNPLAVCRT